MSKTGFLAALVVVIALLGCEQKPQTQQPKAPPSKVLPPQSSTHKPDFATNWEIIPGQSEIRFTFLQDGKTNSGVFEHFDARIFFDPQNLKTAKVHVQIDLSSLNTADSERDGALSGPEWFDTDTFPKAVFTADTFRALGTDLGHTKFHVDGQLSLHGIEKPFGFDFTLKPENDATHMQAEFQINRTDFALGQGMWASDSQIGYMVDVRLNVFARAKP